jgi:Uncharacterized conserved protein
LLRPICTDRKAIHGTNFISVGSTRCCCWFWCKYNPDKKTHRFGANPGRKRTGKSQKEAARIKDEAREEAARLIEEGRKEEQTRRKELKDIEQRLVAREETLDKKLDELDKRAEKLRAAENEVEELKEEIREIRKKQQEKLEKIAKLTKEEAAEKLMQMTERDIKHDLMGLVAKLQNEAKENAEEKAGLIIVTAMERMASEVTAERTVTAVKLEDEEMKGRIIGKEGRNIQALQRATGVDIMVDDTPGYVVLSSFDPVRREVARQALEMLMKDGRIHPGRIEEVVEKAQKNVEKRNRARRRRRRPRSWHHRHSKGNFAPAW